MGWECEDWIDMAQERDKGRIIVEMAMNVRVTETSRKVLSSSLSVRCPRKNVYSAELFSSKDKL